ANGRQMSYSVLWKSGAGIAFVLFLLLLMICAWVLAARHLTSRWALVAAPAAPYVASVPFLNSGLISTEDVWFGLLGGSLTAAITYVCLFHLPAVRRYFAASRDAHDRQSSREPA